MLDIKNGQFIDEEGRTVLIRGINFTSDSKFPAKDSHRYVNSPCPLDEVDVHLDRVKNIGFNTIRYLVTWDALQPDHPDLFDEEYIDYTISMLRKAVDRKIYVILDPHQDIWSRFSGGSGAPLWTLHAAGFNHEHFDDTHAAVMWDASKKHQIKMQWASNYFRLVCQTMFTLFFAGPTYSPKTEINGINLGTYLSDKYFAALRHFMNRIKEANLGPYILGFESINEPGGGLIGWEDLGALSSSSTAVKLGTAPTPFQGMLLGQGIKQEVTTYKFTGFGIKKVHQRFLVSPKQSTWLSPDQLKKLDAKYGWERSWPGGCIWELHGIYSAKDRKLLIPDYFRAAWKPHAEFQLIPDAISRVDFHEYLFVNKYFVDHWRCYRDMIEEINPDWFRFMQAPVNAPPPDLMRFDNTAVDGKCVYTPHFYDGLTLMLKRWRFLNVDAVGVMRDLYKSPFRALRFGDKYIMNSFAEQFEFMHLEGRSRLGNIPLIMTEIGIPYDMNSKHAYNGGTYTNQIRAMDANIQALEISETNYCIWCYCINNTHKYGDNFAGEDLSIYSKDDTIESSNGLYSNGIRAAEAVIRPCAQNIAGPVKVSRFDMRNAKFTLTITPQVNAPTVIFAPQYYFPYLSPRTLKISSGTVKVSDQRLTWINEDLGSEQTLEITGQIRFEHKNSLMLVLLEKFLRSIVGEASTLIEKAKHLERGTSNPEASASKVTSTEDIVINKIGQDELIHEIEAGRIDGGFLHKIKTNTTATGQAMSSTLSRSNTRTSRPSYTSQSTI